MYTVCVEKTNNFRIDDAQCIANERLKDVHCKQRTKANIFFVAFFRFFNVVFVIMQFFSHSLPGPHRQSNSEYALKPDNISISLELVYTFYQ